MSETILITGAAGFIGSNFVKTLFDQRESFKDWNFIFLDSLTYSGHYLNIEPFVEGADNFSFEKADIRDREKIESLFNQHQFSGVMNFAAESHVDRSIEDPNIFLETNVMGVMNLLNASLPLHKKNKDFRFLQVGTDEVYGSLQPGDEAFRENHHLKPNSPYSASKASADLMARSYFKTFGLPILITRCSNNYGPFQFPEKLIPLMIYNARQDKKLPVYGDGQNIRDWIYVEDHNRGILEVFQKGKPGEVYNLGGNSEVKNLDLVKLILDQLEKPHDLIEFVTDRPGHDFRYAMNYSKAQKELEWEPQVSFEEGIRKTILWYLENPHWVEDVLAKESN